MALLQIMGNEMDNYASLCTVANRSLRKAIAEMPDERVFACSAYGAIFYSFDLGKTWRFRVGHPDDRITGEGLPQLQVPCHADPFLVMCADDQFYEHVDGEQRFVGEGADLMPAPGGVLPAAEDPAYAAQAREDMVTFLIEGYEVSSKIGELLGAQDAD